MCFHPRCSEEEDTDGSTVGYRSLSVLFAITRGVKEWSWVFPIQLFAATNTLPLWP